MCYLDAKNKQRKLLKNRIVTCTPQSQLLSTLQLFLFVLLGSYVDTRSSESHFAHLQQGTYLSLLISTPNW